MQIYDNAQVKRLRMHKQGLWVPYTVTHTCKQTRGGRSEIKASSQTSHSGVMQIFLTCTVIYMIMRQSYVNLRTL